MSQPVSGVERREAPRRPAAFAFWLNRGAREAGAWMVDVSDSGAAFLTGVDEAPVCGEEVGLREMFAMDCHVRAVARELPPVARVVRVEEGDVTKRVAVRFEEAARVGVDGQWGNGAKAACVK